MQKLDILYMCDDGFAEIAGVSITSLFEQNPRERIQLTVYLLGVNISEKNKERFRQTAEKYGQEVILIDAEEQFAQTQKMNLDTYRGSAMTNLRLRFDLLLPQTVHRLLYIDCDTVICDSLEELADFPMEGKLLGMVLDAYGKILDIDGTGMYYNAGVLLIDCDKWRQEAWREQIDKFVSEKTQKLLHPDQDVFNILCREEIVRLPIRYNFQAVHREYSDSVYFRHLAPKLYYTAEEIESARKRPGIVHLIRVLGTNPWYADGNLHPAYDLYIEGKAKSEWREEPPKEKQPDFVFQCERALKAILPKNIFFPLTIVVTKMSMKMENTGKV